MPGIMIAGNSLKMTSREIAELTGKQHKHVLDDCRKMFEALNIQSADFSADYKDERGRTYQEFWLDQDLTLTLMTGYSIPLRHKVSQRWRELESRNAKPTIPQSLPEALRLAADLAEEKQQLENQLALAAPKVDFADRVAEASGVLIGNFAKTVGVGPNKLFAWLRDNGVLIAGGSRRNVPMQEYMDRGYFTLKETPVETNHGMQISFTTKITGKGQQWLTRKLLSAGILKAVGNAA